MTPFALWVLVAFGAGGLTMLVIIVATLTILERRILARPGRRAAIAFKLLDDDYKANAPKWDAWCTQNMSDIHQTGGAA
jgi:hypothetical protein